MDQNLEDFPEPRSHIKESRRRRVHRQIIPTNKTERSFYVNEIAKRLIPGLDYYLFSMLCGLILGVAILVDHPALYVMAALAAPFLSPVIGLGFSTAIGSIRFFFQSIISLLIGAAFVFAGGAISGGFSKLFITSPLVQIQYHSKVSTADVLLIMAGTILAVILTIRQPKQKSIIASAALAYEVFLPVGIAGFGLASGSSQIFSQALMLVGINLLIVMAAGGLTSAVLKLRPFNFFGYGVSAALLVAAVIGVASISALGSAVESQLDLPTATQPEATQMVAVLPTPSETAAPPTEQVLIILAEPTPTNTLVPTRTPTITITPKPTEMWGKVNSQNPAYNGVYVRKTPGYNGEFLKSLLNGELVQIMPDRQFIDNTYWAHIILDDGQEGWIVESLLVTNTPEPN